MEPSPASISVRDDGTDEFARHRSALFGVAYRMLGRFADAEDVVQEAWLRWAGADRASIRDPKAWLVTATTRLAIDRLRRVQANRETYVGPWLPEPVITTGDVAEEVVRSDSVSIAMLVVLEALSPLERAVFVLREAFDFDYRDIAQILGRSEASVRQLASRARSHVAERATRYDADPKTRRAVTEQFVHASLTGDLTTLLKLLAPGVRLVSDSGGIGRAPRRVIEGADKVARFFIAIAQQPLPDMTLDFTDVNGQPGLIAYTAGVPAYVMVIDTAGGNAAQVSLFANPEKLRGIGSPVPLAPAS